MGWDEIKGIVNFLNQFLRRMYYIPTYVFLPPFFKIPPDHGVRCSVATVAHVETEPCPNTLGASFLSACEQFPCLL
jgi:hypothetical protein